jgi:hypothetical protein
VEVGVEGAGIDADTPSRVGSGLYPQPASSQRRHRALVLARLADVGRSDLVITIGLRRCQMTFTLSANSDRGALLIQRARDLAQFSQRAPPRRQSCAACPTRPSPISRKRVLPHAASGTLGRLRGRSKDLLRGSNDRRRRVPVERVGSGGGRRSRISARALRAEGAGGRLVKRWRAHFVFVRGDRQDRARRGRLSRQRTMAIQQRLRSLSVGISRRRRCLRQRVQRARAGRAYVPPSEERLPD